MEEEEEEEEGEDAESSEELEKPAVKGLVLVLLLESLSFEIPAKNGRKS